jgi:hypothetical protein
MSVVQKYSYSTIKEVFDLLHHYEIEYVVLRNYDNILENEIYMDGHGDIDLLCSNSVELAKKIKANPDVNHFNNGLHDKVHYFFYINNNSVSLDLRFVGDNYYCEKWEKEMLERRVLHKGFYVLSDEDHFYSLIYHAIFQKECFSEEYNKRLIEMAEKLNIKLTDRAIPSFVSVLESYMKKNHYQYVYPKDKYVPFMKKYIIDQSIFKFITADWFNHIKYHKINELKQSLHFVKRFFKI